jgi:uncharacterized NAD(P)/FAD-binding protein YdhS
MGKRILIVGGGLSGTLLALQFAKRKGNHEVILLEKNPQLLGRGIAYNNDFTHQPLNVPASGMSLFPETPDHFVQWLTVNAFRYNHLIREITPESFVPRKIFGDYIVEQLQKAHHDHNGTFEIRIDEVLSLTRRGKQLVAGLESGIALEADEVILALGNFPPGDLFPLQPGLNTAPGYFPFPWSDEIYSGIRGEENILLVGTGLSAVDVALGLHLRNFRGHITMLSRRGKLPLPHNLAYQAIAIDDPGYLNPREALLWLKEQMKKNHAVPWTAVMDGIRPLTQLIWKRWSNEEKSYFLKRLRPIWEVVRHRIPAQSSAVLEELMQAQQLEVRKGKIVSGKTLPDGIEVTWQEDEKTRQAVYNKVINCTGPESNYRKVKLPVLGNLMDQGLLVNDALGLGILCTEEGRIIGKDNLPVQGLWCIGPMRKAVLWETTAIRELRIQALELSELVPAG